MNKLLLAAIILGTFLVLGFSAQASAIRYGEVRGITNSTVNGTLNVVVTTKDDSSFAFAIQAFNGDLNNTRILVKGNTLVSPAQAILIDNFTAGTNTTFGHFYDNDHLGSLVPVNPATLPFINIQTTKGDAGATQKLTYQALR